MLELAGSSRSLAWCGRMPDRGECRSKCMAGRLCEVEVTPLLQGVPVTRSLLVAVATIVFALLACKGKGGDQDLPEAPPLPSTEEDQTQGASSPAPAPAPSVANSAAGEGKDATTSGDAGSATPKVSPDGGTAKSDGADSDSSDKDASGGKDAGATAPPSFDASVGDLQKRAEQCINRCSAQFEKCKSVDISKLGECIQNQASCTAACR